MDTITTQQVDTITQTSLDPRTSSSHTTSIDDLEPSLHRRPINHPNTTDQLEQPSKEDDIPVVEED